MSNGKRGRVRDGYLGDLPEEVRSAVMNVHKLILRAVDDVLKDPHYADLRDSSWARSCFDEFCVMPMDKKEVGSFRCFARGRQNTCAIRVTGRFMNHRNDWIEDLTHDFIKCVTLKIRPTVRKQYNMAVKSEGDSGGSYECIELYPAPKVSKQIWEALEDKTTKAYKEAAESKPRKKADPAAGKDAMKMVTISIKHKCMAKDAKLTANDIKKYEMLINHWFLENWAPGYKEVKIRVSDYQSFPTFEFVMPKMTKDFVGRFVEGRESINGFLHRDPVIHIKVSPRIFHTMKNDEDAYNFFKAALTYYGSGLEKTSQRLMAEAMKMPPELKRLVGTTDLSGIVTYPMQLLFVFNDVDMTNTDTFTIKNDDVKAVTQFIKNIYTRYPAPEKEKKAIIADVKQMVKTLTESFDLGENRFQFRYFAEAVEQYLMGGFDQQIADIRYQMIEEQVDVDWVTKQKDPKLIYLQESYGVKKLKKIPSDLVAYISIETDAIRDANDKMMIASYTIGKIEIVEWYIELLVTGSKKYIVPHTKPWLENVRTQLMACYKRIMDTKITPASQQRPIISVQYPPGYEG